jgi:hypothetical protein
MQFTFQFFLLIIYFTWDLVLLCDNFSKIGFLPGWADRTVNFEFVFSNLLLKLLPSKSLWERPKTKTLFTIAVFVSFTRTKPWDELG